MDNHNLYLQNWKSSKVCDIISKMNAYTQEGYFDNSLTTLYDILDCVYGKRYVKGNVMKKTDNKREDNWFDDECKNFKRVVNRVMRNYLTSRSHFDREIFCTTRRNYKKLITSKKNSFFYDKTRQIIDAAKNKDSKKFWSFFRNRSYVGNDITSDEWFDYFRSIFDVRTINDHDNNEYDVYAISDAPELPGISCHDLNCNIERAEIVNVIQSLKGGKACGIDGISPEIIKFAPSIFTDILYDLFQKCFLLGTFPDQWKVGLIHPVYKKGDKNNPASYRPITLLCIMSKLFTRILSNRLNSWLEEHGILSPAQAGFRKNFSTIDNCFVIHTAISKALRQPRGKLYTAFIDLKAAFDNLDRKILFRKLVAIGIRGQFLKILHEMYRSVRSRVKCTDGLTPEFECTTGVRQGDNLSPILFSLYLNDLEDILCNCTYPGIKINNKNLCCLLYADDIVIFSYNAFSLQKLLNEFETYCMSNKLIVNKDKPGGGGGLSKIVVFRKGGYLASHEKWSFMGRKMEVVNSYNYLGLIFTPKGIWQDCTK